MILLIDNYDSFSYNLYQLIGTIEPDIKVIRNDEMTVEEVKVLNPQLIILSPGPGRPDQAGICEEVVKTLGSKYSDFRCVPWSSGNLRSLWRQNHSRKEADAWKDFNRTFRQIRSFI